MRITALTLALVALAPTSCVSAARQSGQLARIAYVVDGDTVQLTNGKRVRLVQIDTPEVYGSHECYGARASGIAKHLLPPGTEVRLYTEPKTDAVDRYGRLLRYVVIAKSGWNVNVRLVRLGAAAPYFYNSRRGRYAQRLVSLGLHARAHKLGLWGRCPGTPWDPNHGVSTGPA